MKNKIYNYKFFIIFLTISLFLWGLLTAIHIPLYIDEPTISTFWERTIINGGFRQNYYPNCDQSFLMQPPLLLMPAAATLSILGYFGENYYMYRIIPILGWLAILSFLYANGHRHQDQSFWPFLLILLVGPTLYSLVILRPEIFILTFSVLLYFFGSRNYSYNQMKTSILEIILLILGYDLTLYMHPKVIYLAPAMMFVIFIRAKKFRKSSTRILVSLSSVSIIIGQTISAAWFFTRTISCEKNQSISNLTNSAAINPVQLFSNPSAFFKNFDTHYFNFLWSATSQQVSYKNNHIVGGFLPNAEVSPDFLSTVRWIVLVILILIIIVVLKNIFKIATTKNLKNLKWNNWLIFLIGLGLIGPYFLNLHRYFYDVSFLETSIVLMACLSWPLFKDISVSKSIYINRIKEIIIPLIFIILGLFGRVMNNKFYDIPLLGGYRESNSLVLFSDFGPLESYGEIVRKILIQKGISLQEPLIVDDITYNMVFKHPILINVAALNDYDPSNPRFIPKLLIKRKIKYMVTGCGPFPPGFRSGVEAKVLYILKISPSLRPSPVTNNICIVKLSYSKIIK